jgi:predicted heme/steroid binding protein
LQTEEHAWTERRTTLSPKADLRRFTMAELAECHGRDGTPAYFGYEGKVYDAGSSRLWRNGVHQKLHESGCDLSGCLRRAPHTDELLRRLKVVGELVDGVRLDECR